MSCWGWHREDLNTLAAQALHHTCTSLLQAKPIAKSTPQRSLSAAGGTKVSPAQQLRTTRARSTPLPQRTTAKQHSPSRWTGTGTAAATAQGQDALSPAATARSKPAGTPLRNFHR